MLDAGESLSDEDVARIAELHHASIDDSLPGLLGEGFARRFYRFLAASAKERLFIERIDGRVESVCVVSFDPATLYGRIVAATWPVLVLSAAVALLSSSDFRAYLRGQLAHGLGGGELAKAPEITFIFTNAGFRGKRLGQRLIERVDRALAESGVETYFVKTLDDSENRAIAFYDGNGFDRLGVRSEAGRRFVEFQRCLVPNQCGSG